MKIGAPVRGMVVRYAFLWSDEASVGKDEASKERPCAIVITTKDDETKDTSVTVVPITHSPPAGSREAHMKLPPRECHSLGLDSGEHWVVLDELNRFTWPGFDLRPVPGTGSYEYGMISKDTFGAIIDAIIQLDQTRKREKALRPKAINRDE